MAFGTAMSVCWPLFFGTGVTREEGHLGMWLALVVISLITWLFLKRWPGRYPILANGLLALGTLCLIPILPLVMGGLILAMLRVPLTSKTLGFADAFTVTLAYSACYLGFALITGCFIRDIRRLKHSPETGGR